MDKFEYKISHNPDYAMLTVNIPAGKKLKVEASAMAAMDTNIRMKTKMKGGFSRFLTGESLFINEFSAENGNGQIMISPGSPGDLTHVYLNDSVIYLQNSGYVASGLGVILESKWQGMMRGFFSGESLFLIKCLGTGDLWFNSFGAIIEIDVDGEYIVDTGYIVAFESTLDYHVHPVGGLKATFLSGEGLVCRFAGRGKLWIQTRQVGSFANWLFPFRPVKRSSSD